MQSTIIRRPTTYILLRYQLVGAIATAGLIPYLVMVAIAPDRSSLPLLNQSLALVTVATVFGCWLLRNLATYPGVEKTNYVFPSFATSYALAVGGLVLSRLNYSRPLLFVGFAVSIVWFYFVRIADARQRSFCVALTPFTDRAKADGAVGISWVPFTDPATPPSQIDAVATDLRVDMPDSWERALADLALRNVPVYHIKHLLESVSGRVELEHISENNFGSLSPISAYMSLKHIFDRSIALIALVLFLPLFIVLVSIIRLDSPGPGLFRQRRIGYQGRPFTVYKLRTMSTSSTSADASLSAAMTQKQDTRVTRVGKYLRSSRLDELPQLINVLKGEMSWIGPRPEADVLSKWYEAEIPFYRYRHIVRPGITGWAQVNQGHVSDVADVIHKLQFDFYYIKNFSPWLDMLIVARTVRTMLTGFGAR